MALESSLQFGQWPTGDSEAEGLCHGTGEGTTSVCAQAASAEQIQEGDSSGGLQNMFDLDRCQSPKNQGSFSLSLKIPLKYDPIANFSNINIHYTHTNI